MINKKQKTIGIIVTALIIASCWFLIPCKTAYAATSGDFEYTVNSDGTSVTISGYTGEGGDITIPDTLDGYTVTAIGFRAFDESASENKLKSVIISDNVESIGDMSFCGCRNLSYIRLSKSLKSIETWAFMQCESLKEIIIPASVNGIGDRVFGNCYSLTKITVIEDNHYFKSIDGALFNKDGTELLQYTIGNPRTSYSVPNGVTVIGKAAFECSLLKSITLPSGIKSIKDNAFSGCLALESINIPEGVTDIGNSAFWGCNIENVSIPSSVNSIGYQSFGECNKLESVNLTEGLQSMGFFSFIGCRSLRTITIPNSVTSIGLAPFASCIRLDEILVKQENDNYKSVDGVLFNFAGTELIQYPPGKARTRYVIPSGVTQIGYYAFCYCCNLKEIVIPDGVKRIIGDNVFDRCGIESINIPSSVESMMGFVFSECDNLKEINVDKSNLLYKSIDGVLFNKSGNTLLQYPKGRMDVNYIIPEGVTEIGSRSFYSFNGERNLANIYIPSSVTAISTYAFQELNPDPSALTIYGQAGSVAQNYAETNKVKFIVGELILVSGIELSEDSILLQPGEEALIRTTLSPDNAMIKTVQWTSSDSNVASVINGKITAHHAGTVTITATTKDGGFTDTCTVTVRTSTVRYQTHVQNVGWQGWKTNGEVAGTSGQSLRLEGMNIKIDGMPDSIEYRTHVQDIGWQGWVRDGAMTGTSGRSLRLEAIEIRLTGVMAGLYDIYYRVHAQNIGWMDWAKNGQSAGTAGLSYRLEAIQIKLVPKGGAAPGPTAVPFRNANGPVPTNPNPIEPEPTNPSSEVSVSYQTHVQNIGWQGWKINGEIAGTSGQSLRLEGMYIDVEGNDNAAEYRTHVQNIGWQNWVDEGEMTGTSGRSLRLEAIEIRLKGEMATNYDIYYRVHAQNIGWMDWAKNGQSAGTAGLSYRLEAIQIVIVQKGNAAPGSTARPFVSA